ncbi:MAG: DNA-binding protein [Proteobacteria bacterium]|nr:DNA-binding protein [Pseudomonadota bacterium]
MGFERFGTVSFTSKSKVDHFVDLLDQGMVSGTRCKECGKSFFPPRADCFNCFSAEMEWFEITGVGDLISYSTLTYAPTGFEQDLPYSIALVQFSNDLKLFGRLSREIKAEEIKIDMKLRITSIKLPNDRVSYEFREA